MKTQLFQLYISIRYIIIIIVTLCNISIAQPIVSRDQFQSLIGTSEIQSIYSSSDLNGLDALISIKGNNKTWDITGRAFTFQRSDTCSYLDSFVLTSSRHDSEFLNCNFVNRKTSSNTSDTTLGFYFLSDTAFCWRGDKQGQKIGGYFWYVANPPFFYWKFPATIGTTWDNSVMITVYPLGISQSYNDSVEVDGYGTVITPSGTFACLRLCRKVDNGSQILYFFTDGLNIYATIETDRDNVPTNIYYTNYNFVNEVSNDGDMMLSTRFGLSQNYPNPFNPSTTIKYELPTESFVTLKVNNIFGQEVTTLVDEKQLAGKHEVRFDAVNLPSGVYFYRLNVGEYIQARKLLFLK